jgi:hypothetical protein
MAKAPTRPPQESAQAPPGTDTREPTPFEKMTELARRIIRVPKSEVVEPKRKGKRSDA